MACRCECRCPAERGQLQRADSHAPGDWDRSYVALHRGDRETLTRLYESKPALRNWIGPRIGIIDDGGDQAERHVTRNFKLRHFADLARGPSPETPRWFADHWRLQDRGRVLQSSEVLVVRRYGSAEL